jgi:hypothetical protein
VKFLNRCLEDQYKLQAALEERIEELEKGGSEA